MAVTRRVPGAICLRTSTHLVPSENSNTEKPVMFAPGRDKLATKPWPSGSVTVRNTIGMERVACRRPLADGVEWATNTSGCSPTSSFASA
jgi:hypothetical protein